MEEVEKNNGGSDKNMREIGCVDFAEVAGQEAILSSLSAPSGRARYIPFPHTLAISSLFLNSPSVSITSPFSSTSVHRKRGSRAALAACVRLGLNMEPGPPLSSRDGRSSGFSGLGFPVARPQSISRQDGLHIALGMRSEDRYRCVFGTLDVLALSTRERCF